MLQNDFLVPLFSLHPVAVALIILVWGWGNLFLFAVKTKILNKFLRHPGFMIGDLVMLPLAGFLITYFYQSVSYPAESFFTSAIWSYSALILAGVLSLFNAYRSIFAWKTIPLDIVILPHFFFYWFMAYILLVFILKGLLQVVSTPSLLLWILYVGVITAISLHLVFSTVFGLKKFTK